MAAILTKAVPQLPSADLAKSEDYFCNVLGFQLVATYDTLLIVARDNAEIHFWKTANDEQAKMLGSASSCYIRVEATHDLYKEFKAKGAVFGYELEKKPWGMMEMQVNDPYGNAIRFGEPLA